MAGQDVSTAAIKVRVHCVDPLTHDDLVACLGRDLFLVREVGKEGRPHWQGLLYQEPTKERLKKLRNDITRKLKITGNRAYSIAEAPEPEGYIRYLCKGADCDKLPEVLCNDRAVDIEAGHADYWAENARLIEENPKGYKRKSIFTVLQEECDAKMLAVDIYEKAVHLHHEAGKIARRATIKDMVFTIRTKNAYTLRKLAETDCAGL